jgi:Protein of unknown function (DUF4233)
VRMLCSAVLAIEALVVALAIAPALALVDGHHAAILWGGLAVVALDVLAVALVRGPAGYVLGSLVQVLVLAAGLVLPVMFLLGAVFTVLWVVAIRLPGRAERVRATRPAGPAGPQRRA